MAIKYFDDNIEQIERSLHSIDEQEFERLLSDCQETLANGHKIIASGLGKNEAICEKFVGTMLSLGFDAGFLNTNSAVHGDLGMVKPGDLVLILTKSGSTAESVYLNDQLMKRSGVKRWLITFNPNGRLSSHVHHKLVIKLDHEGDLWNIVPNNSTTVTLIVLQEIAIEMSKRFDLDLDKDFKPNHPGGAIGEKLNG